MRLDKSGKINGIPIRMGNRTEQAHQTGWERELCLDGILLPPSTHTQQQQKTILAT